MNADDFDRSEITERCAECEISAGYASRWQYCAACEQRYCHECWQGTCPESDDGNHTVEAAEPPEPDGECFRGREAAAYEAEQMDRWQRELKR